MQKLNIKETVKSLRNMDMKETLNLLKQDVSIFFSWGPHAFTNFNNRLLRFKVNAYHHKGHVYIGVNGSDLYNVWLTTTKGTIKKEIKDLYFDQLVEVIDKEIEYIESYQY
jgi:hypothetical protein